MTYQLSQGAISKILKGQEPRNPILQCLNTYDLAGGHVLSTDIALVLSDSIHSYRDNLIDLAIEGCIKQYTLLRLKHYRSTLYRGSRIVMCYDVEILETSKKAGGKIGNPEQLKHPDDYFVYHFLSGQKHTNLTTGAIMELVSGKQPYQPILQCLGTKSITGSGVPRMRLVLSDGVHSFATAMLATQLNDLVHDGSLLQYAVFQAIHYQSFILTGKRRILILLDIDILEFSHEAVGQIGEPIPLSISNEGLICTSQPGNENINPSEKPKTSNKCNQQKIYIMPPQN